jgi:hypothetical protein
MLNISHKLTIAYHPKSNAAVKRLHRHLKDALCARAAAATWSEELSFVLLGLRAQTRDDSGLFPAEAVFGAQIILPNEFFQNDELSVDTIVKMFSDTLHVSAPSLPRHNSSTDLPSELPAELLSAPLVWVRPGSMVPPLQPVYDGPYTVLRHGPCSFTIRVGMQDEVVAISHFKAVQLQPSGSRFQTRWFFHLPLYRRHHVTVPEPFSYPARRFLHARDRQRFHSLLRRGTRPVNEHHPRG